MSLPTYDKFIEPILRFLASKPEAVPAREAHEAAATALGLTEEQRQELLPSGTQPVYKNRAGWAHDRLKRAGLSQSPRRGYWELTSTGRDYEKKHAAPLSEEALEELAKANLDVMLAGHDESIQPGDVAAAIDVAIASKTASPDDRLELALKELRETVAAELLEHLRRVSPTFFETIVLDVLHRMGYGASRTDLVRVGGSGDGGIDGIISLDKLGLEKVYVQAKRWQNGVGRPEIQAFYGALAGQRANKGVFITTSSFTVQAIEFARSVERIVLVDGKRLADLMIDHDVGVSARVVRVPKIDGDYFDEDLG